MTGLPFPHGDVIPQEFEKQPLPTIIVQCSLRILRLKKFNFKCTQERHIVTQRRQPTDIKINLFLFILLIFWMKSLKIFSYCRKFHKTT